MGLTPVPAGHLATIVTSLEMTERPRPAPLPAAPLRLAPWKNPTPDAYRTLFRRIGGPWLWFSRLAMSDAELIAIIHHDEVAVYAVLDQQGIEVGMLELDFRTPNQCELAFLGLIPELNGKGLGKWMMANALALGWRKNVERLWVHTCTLDAPGALTFYRKSGFRPYATAIETFPDPRLIGLLPREAAPHIPLLEGEMIAR